MNTDFKSLEQRYGTSLAMKIWEEIARAEQKHNSFYRVHDGVNALPQMNEDGMRVKQNMAA
jgi:hypothetical protein